ncbi:MAG: hypothetical protein ACSLE6_02975 [Mycobacterium sp.]
MAITYSSPPEEARQLARQGVESVANHTEAAEVTMLTTVQANEAELSAPHVIHHVTLDDLVARRPLGGSAVIGWRYLVLDGSEAFASSEVSAGDDERQPALAQVNQGPDVQSTAATLAKLSDTDVVRADDYQVRVLKIPALGAHVLWLSQIGGDQDLFIPLAPAPEYLLAGRMYREEELLDALEGPAQDQLDVESTRFGT